MSGESNKIRPYCLVDIDYESKHAYNQIPSRPGISTQAARAKKQRSVSETEKFAGNSDSFLPGTTKDKRSSRVFEEVNRSDGTKSKVILEVSQREGFKTSRISLVEKKVLSVQVSKEDPDSCTALVPYTQKANSSQDLQEPHQKIEIGFKKKKILKWTVIASAFLCIGVGVGILSFSSLAKTDAEAQAQVSILPSLPAMIQQTTLKTLSMPEALKLPDVSECTAECIEASSRATTPNGKFFCNASRVSVECSTGFKAQGQSIACTDIAAGLHSLRCFAKSCPDPDPPKHGRVVCQPPFNMINSTCTVWCDNQISKTDQGSMRCQEDQTWTEAPSCQAPSCSSPTNTTGSIACTSSGDNCIKTCSQEEISQVVSCQDTGEWNFDVEDEPCEPACKLEVSHGIVNCSNHKAAELFQQFGAPPSSECSLVCNAGFRVSGSRTASCSSKGRWTTGECEATVLVLAGGKTAGEQFMNREIFHGYRR